MNNDRYYETQKIKPWIYGENGEICYIEPMTYIYLSRTHAAEPLLGINIDAASVHSLVFESYFCTKSIPSPSSRIAPPQT